MDVRTRAEDTIDTSTERFLFEPVLERDGARVSRSPWGLDDEIGRLNWVTPESQRAILEGLDGTKLLDLSVDYFVGMPSFVAAADPKYDIWMTHTPDGSIRDGLTGLPASVHERYSYCGDAITMYTHCGTHIDTLNHLGFYGCFWNGRMLGEHLGSRGWISGGAEKYPTIVARGVLLDIARLYGVDCLPADHVVTPADVRHAARAQSVELRRGDVVLLRFGQMTKWPTADYTGPSAGIGLAAARYLCEDAGAMCIGGDSLGLEVSPPEDPETFLPVHAYMFATAGAQILEVVWTEDAAADGLWEFAFIGGPLKLTGATGAPLRPIAVALRR